MIDPVSVSVGAILHGDAARLPLVVAAGAITSFGPCVAPRYVAVASVLAGGRRTLAVATFVAGMLTAYAALGFGIGVLAGIAEHASAVYAVLAFALAVAGLTTLLRPQHREHEHDVALRRPQRLSATFSLGAGSAFIVSPCCTPVVAAVAALTGNGAPLLRAEFLGAFALGHAAPLILAAPLGTACARRFHAWNASPAPAIVSGALMLALAGYYGLLV